MCNTSVCLYGLELGSVWSISGFQLGRIICSPCGGSHIVYPAGNHLGPIQITVQDHIGKHRWCTQFKYGNIWALCQHRYLNRRIQRQRHLNNQNIVYKALEAADPTASQITIFTRPQATLTSERQLVNLCFERS